MDELFDRTIKYSENTFTTNRNINLVVVSVGVLSFLYAFFYSAIRGVDLLSTAFGALGAVDFIATFWFSPQRNIQKLIGKMVQLQIFYRTHWEQVEIVLDYARDKRLSMTMDDLEKLTTHLSELSREAAKEIEAKIS